MSMHNSYFPLEVHMLNLTLTSKFCIIAVNAVFIMIHTEAVDMFMISFHAEFHMPSSGGSLVIPVKHKITTQHLYSCHTVLHYTAEKEITLTQLHSFRKRIPTQNLNGVLSNANVTAILEFS
jgi:hypothetical protein